MFRSSINVLGYWQDLGIDNIVGYKFMSETLERPIIPDPLADRYPSTPMVRIFSTEAKIIFERELWITVMKAQQELGLKIPKEAIRAYEEA